MPTRCHRGEKRLFHGLTVAVLFFGTASCGEGRLAASAQCSDTSPPVESRESTCYDGKDDDCDGAADCSDADCEGSSCNGTGCACREGSCVCPTNPQVFFYDGFERNPGGDPQVDFVDNGPWTEQVTLGGTQAITANRPFFGTRSREVHNTRLQSTQASEIGLHVGGLGSSISEVYYLRFFVFFDLALEHSTQRKMIYEDPGDDSRVNFYFGRRHSGGSGGDAIASLGQTTIHIRNHNQPTAEPSWNCSSCQQLDGWWGSPGLIDSSPPLMDNGTWYCIEAMVRKSASDGEIRVWIDDVEKMRFNKDTWGLAAYGTGIGVGQLELTGFFNFSTNASGQAEWYDEVAIGTERIGCSYLRN